MLENTTSALPDSLTNTRHFARTVAHWQKQHGRRHLPWQNTRDAYRIWLSEIMLQQTQVATVINYYHRFLNHFPTLHGLANAPQEEVMSYWAGLGYYARARNLHRCAQTIVEKWGGTFPRQPEQIETLPGIGRSTAGAIAAFSYQCRTPIMDGNVKRVFTRYFGIYGYPAQKKIENTLWERAHTVLNQAPENLDTVAYTQGLMDLGSTVCTRSKPNCVTCPLTSSCHARQHGVQHILPTPRPRKTLAEKQCHMLILIHGQSVLLEKRPQTGIWGGLWSLPQYENETLLQAHCQNRGLTLEPAQRMAPFLHTFTHFKLHITPWWVNAGHLPLHEPVTTQRWHTLNQLDQVGLPTPVRKILKGVAQAN